MTLRRTNTRARPQPAHAWLVVGFLAACLFPMCAAHGETLTVVITSPPAGQPVFGEARLAADLLVPEGDAVARVDFFVDDQFIESRSAPPWEVTVDVGGENAAHRFEVVAQTRGGLRGSALLVSRAIAVDLELEAALQQLYVTVEQGGERVLDLDRGDFRVFDDGEEQTLVTFERGDVPLTASILVDASNSMRGDRLRAALDGAGAFIRGMQPLDQAQLLLFSDRVLHETPFTSISEVLQAGLQAVRADGGTALVDHLYLAMHRLEPHQGRRVILLLSDGVDVSSFLTMDEVDAALRRSQALIYWLRLGRASRDRRYYSAWKADRGHRHQLDLLEQAVRRSGGRVVEIARDQPIAEAFARILRELRDQYVLGYYPSSDVGDGRWHGVRVETDRRDLEVRTREGYLDR